MSGRDVLRGLAAGRVAVGAGLIAVPAFVGGRWVGPDAAAPGTKVLGRALGVRDLVLGLGTLEADRRGESLRTWLLAGAIADTVDLVATAAAGDGIPTPGQRATVAIAGAAALTGLVLLRGAE